MFFLEDRLAQLRWTRQDLAAAGGPAPSTLRKARLREGLLAPRTLAQLDFALGWQEGSAEAIMAGASPAVRISDLVSSCSIGMEAALGDNERYLVGRCAMELKKFLDDVAQRLSTFYTEPALTVEGGADVRPR
ncbi:hypothetical protein A9W97_23705 [Mycobacterium gordonae]|nr:hypothetical protein A9W97_23705 [Mycobacterium gordonae]